MAQRSRLGSRSLFSLMVAIAAVSGCRSYPPTLSAVSSTRTVGTAVVKADVSALFARLHGQGRQVQGLGFMETSITSVRLSAGGPDFAVMQSASVPYSAGTVGGTLSLSLPAGINRVFMLEGLDASGRVLASLVSLADLASDATLTLTFNGDTDVAGRVLFDAMSADPTIHPNATTLKTTPLVTPLLSFVNQVTGLNTATNQFTRVNPLAVDRPQILAGLLDTGLTFLQSAPPAALMKNAWGRLVVLPTEVNGRFATSSPVKVEVFDSNPTVAAAITPNAAGEIVIDNVPPGDWWVRVTATNGGSPPLAVDTPVWSNVHVDPYTYRKLPAFPYAPAPSPLGLVGLSPAIAGKPDGSQELLVWSDAGQLKGQFLAGDRSLSGTTFSLNGALAGPHQAPEVVYNPVSHEYLVTWMAGGTGVLPGTLYAQRVGEDGTMQSPAVTLASGGSYKYSVACNSNDGTYMVADTDGSTLQVTRLTPVASTATTTTPWVNFAPSTTVTYGQVGISYSWTANAYMMVWDDNNTAYTGNGYDVYVSQVSAATGALVGPTYNVANGTYDQKGVVIAPYAPSSPIAGETTPNPDFMVAWEDYSQGPTSAQVMVRRIGSSSSGAFLPTSAVTLSSQGGNNLHPRLSYMPQVGAGSPPVYAPSADYVMVSWEQQGGGTYNQIHARRIAGAGSAPDARGEEVLSTNMATGTDAGAGYHPAVYAHPVRGDYTVVWQTGTATGGGLVKTVVP